MESSLLLLLPTVLFVITLAVFLLLRAKDRQETKLPMIRKMAEQTIGEIEKINTQFRQDVTDMEVQVADKENEIKEHIQTITRQIKELDSYSDDLARLRKSMSTYQEALSGLAKLTSDADSKIQQVEGDVTRLSEVRQTIEGFRADLEEFKAYIEDQKISIEELERNAVDHVEATGKTVSSECDSYLGRVDASLNNASQTVQQLIAELQDETSNIITELGDKASEQMDLANKINMLLEQKTSLEGDLNSLNEQIQEKRTVNAELAELSVQQSDKIREVQKDIERLEEEKRTAETALSEFEEKASSQLEAAIEETFVPDPEPTVVPQEREKSIEDPAIESFKVTIDEPAPFVDSFETSMPEFGSEPASELASEPVVESYVEPEPEINREAFEQVFDVDLEPEPELEPDSAFNSEPEIEQEPITISRQKFEDSDLGEIPDWEEDLLQKLDEGKKVDYTGEDEEIVFD